jgi:hypothetical protein
MRKLIILSLLFLICAFYFGCKKNQDAIVPQNLSGAQQELITNARKYFENNVGNSTNTESKTLDGLSGNNQGYINPVKSLIKNAVWSKASILKISIGNIVVVPIQFNDSLYARPSYTDSSTRLSINNLSKLIIYTDSSKQFHAEVVSSFPDKDYINNPKQNFSGVAFVQDWQGNFLKGYQYVKGQTLQLSLNDSSNAIKISANAAPNELAPPSDMPCTAIDWYSCSGTEENPYEYCTYYTQNI